MLFLPPGSAKSTYASVLFPSWYLGRNPQKAIIGASNTCELSETFGRRVRNIVAQQEYSNVFNVTLSPDSQAAGRWSMTNQSEYYAVGIGGSVVGRRSDLGIIDDPVKSREDAESELSRNKVWDWYKTDFYTRLKPNAAVILIMTRYHEDDLAGRLLVDSENGGEQWEVLKLPMLAQDNDPLGRAFGELLWPEWFNDDMVTQARRDERVWSSLYQQEPTSIDGGLFKREWFKRYKTAPPDLHKYMTSDHAPAGMSHNDYSGVRVWGIDHLGDIYLLDGFRAQETMDITCDKALKLIERHKPFAWFPENDNNWKSVSGFVTRMMRERNIFTRIEPISPHGADKPTKAQAFQAMVASGRVYIPDTHEGDEIISQYTKFPDAKNDDEVDMGSLIGRAIADAHPAILKIKEVPKTRDIWAMQFDKDEESWKTA